MRWPPVLGTGFGGTEMGQGGTAALGHQEKLIGLHPTHSPEAPWAGRDTRRRTSFSGLSSHSCCYSKSRCEAFLHIWKGRRAMKGKEDWQDGPEVAQKSTSLSCLTAETHRIHCAHLNSKPVFISRSSPTSAQSTYNTEYLLHLNEYPEPSLSLGSDWASAMWRCCVQVTLQSCESRTSVNLKP